MKTINLFKKLCSNNLDIHRDWGGYGIIAPNLREGF